MLFPGIDQRARQLTISLCDQEGDVFLTRQVFTQPERILEFFDQLTRRCAQRDEAFIAVVEVCGFNDWLIHSTVQRIWNDNGLQPHRTRTFKVSNDPKFAEKLVDVVGLYLDPPEHALVLSRDEKSQIQALDRIQKSLPFYSERLKTLTHDYKRNGTTMLFAAIELAKGKIIADCMPRHHHQEWIQFLKQIDARTSPIIICLTAGDVL